MRLYRDLNTVCGLASFIGAMAIVLPPVLMDKKILLPAESREKYDRLRSDLKEEISVVFYSTPLDAVKKALGVE